MSKTKLVSLTIGVSLVVQKDGKEQKSSYSCTTRNKSLVGVLESVLEYLNDELGIGLGLKWEWKDNIKVHKSVQIKAHPSISQEEFNKKIKELVP